MNTTNQGSTCPVCHQPISETAKFCPQCGCQVSAAAVDFTWIAAMQERIRRAKDNDFSYTMLAAVGALIGVTIPFLMHFVLHYTMDTLSWLLTGVGLLFFIGGWAGLWYDERKVKKLIQELEKRQK